MKARKRSAAMIGTAALLLALVPGGASAQQTSNRGIDDACPSAAPDAFNDDGTSVHEDAVDCIAFWDIAQGTGGGRYSPGGNVSRAAMATFIANTMVTAGFSFDSNPPDAFDDDEPSVHEDNINRLADADVVDGVSSTRYAPDRLVTRDQMAKFIARALEVASGTNISTSEDFFDDDEGNVFEPFINELASVGVVQGTGGSNYSPGRDVDRASMASFIARGGDYLHEQGDWPRAFVLLDSDTVAAGGNVTGELGPVSDDDAVASATVSGCGLTNEPVEDTSATEAGIQFSEEIPSSQDEGDCTLTFTVDMTAGADETVTVGITVTEPAAPEAADGTHTDVDVVSVDRGDDSFIGTGDTENHGTERFFYDSGDQFRFSGATITLAQFEAMLTGPESQPGTDGDVLTVTYDDDPGGTSTFNVTTDNVPPVANLTATVDDFDDDGAADDVLVAWTTRQPDAVFDIHRDDEETLTDDEIGPGDTEIDADRAESSIVALNQPDGTHDYLVRAQGGTSDEQSDTVASNEVTVPGEGGAGTGGPRSENLIQGPRDPAPDDVDADAGDSWRFAFDQALAPVNNGDQIRLVEGNNASQEPGEETTLVTNGANATFSLNAEDVTVNGVTYGANRVLTVTLIQDLTVDSGVGDGNITYPLTVQIAPGLSGSGGAPLDWSNSYDRTVESDTTPPTSSEVTATDADGNGLVNSGDSIEVTFDGSMNPDRTQPRTDAVTITDPDGHAITLTHGSNATFTWGNSGLTTSNDQLTITVTSGSSSVNYGDGTNVTNVTNAVYITDPAGHGWNIGGSADRTVNTADDTAPQMSSAAGAQNGVNPDTITVTYSEPVTCNDSTAAAGQFSYDPNTATPGDSVTANAIDCDGDSTLVLTFPNGTFVSGAGSDALTYTQSSNTENRVKDQAGNDAQSPQTISVTG